MYLSWPSHPVLHSVYKEADLYGYLSESSTCTCDFSRPFQAAQCSRTDTSESIIFGLSREKNTNYSDVLYLDTKTPEGRHKPLYENIVHCRNESFKTLLMSVQTQAGTQFKQYLYFYITYANSQVGPVYNVPCASWFSSGRGLFTHGWTCTVAINLWQVS